MSRLSRIQLLASSSLRAGDGESVSLTSPASECERAPHARTGSATAFGGRPASAVNRAGIGRPAGAMLRSRRLAALAPRDWRVGLAPFVVWAAGRVSRVRRATRRLRRARRRDSAGRWARCSFELAGMQDGPPVRYRTRSLRSSCRTQDTGRDVRRRSCDPRRRARSVTCKSIVLLILRSTTPRD